MTRGQSLVASGIAGAMNAYLVRLVVQLIPMMFWYRWYPQPNAELLFSGFDLRNFGLQFKMAPRSAQEEK